MPKTLLISLNLVLLWCFGIAGPGLWHGVDDKNGNTVFFLYLDGERSRLYAPQWTQESELAVEEDRVKFTLPYKTYGIDFEGKLSGTKMTGTWRIHQVQYVVKGTWTAAQLFAVPEWKPWLFLESKASTIDISGNLLKHTFNDFDSFKSFWVRDLEPTVFALFTQSLYVDENGYYRPVQREKRLRELYGLVESVGDAEDRNRKLLEAVSEVRGPLEKKYPWLKNVTVITTFSGGKFDYRPVRIDGRYCLLMGAEYYLSVEDEKEMRRLAAEGLIYSFLSVVSPMPLRGGTEVIRRSLADHLLTQLDLGLASPEGDEVATASKETRDAMGKELGNSFGDFFAAHLTGTNRVNSYLVFREFGKLLAVGRNTSDLIRLSLEDASKILADFFGTSK